MKDERAMLKRRNAVAETVLALAIILNGCSTATRHADAEMGSTSIPVLFVDANGDAGSEKDRPANGIAWFGAIPGAFFGTVRPPFEPNPIGTRPAFAVNLDELQAVYGRTSATMTADAVAHGFKIIPAETRFSRVATSFTYEGARRPGLQIRFVDSDSKNILELVFFDRPCRLTGTIRTPGNAVVQQIVDVTIDKAGLSWLELSHNNADDHDVFRRAPDPARPVFVVGPMQLKPESFQGDPQ